MKTVLIFGGSGFLGSHISDKLIQKKIKVIVFDKRQPYQKGVELSIQVS